jgi:hypothetical protein
MATYHAHVDDIEHFDAATREALIDSLANTLEYDLINKPELCLKRHLVSLNA